MKVGMQIMRPLALSAIMFTMLFTGGVLSPWAATAATYYVATTGNDANPGTQAQPFGTIAKALTVMQAGDTLYLRGGTYTQSIRSNQQVIPSGTSWSNAVTIASYPSETATLWPSGVREVINLPSASYIILDRLVLDAINVSHGSCPRDGGNGTGCNGSVVSHGSSGGHHLRIQNSELKNGYGTNVYLGAASEVLNSKIHGSRFSYGFYLQSSDVVIENNDIYNNGGYAVHIYNGSSGQTVNNVIVRKNRMWGNGYVRSYSAVTVGSGSNCQIYNNLIYNNYGGIDVHGTSEKVYNNTIYNNSPRAAIELSKATNPDIRNNIMWQNASGLVNVSSTGAVMSNNLTTDPQFTNAATNDFRLQPGSPAIDAGVDISVVAVDFDGMTRPQGSRFDTGAYEYPTASSLPAPQNLRLISATP